MNQLASTGPVAVIGAGAIGLSLASALARTGRPITVCGGRTPIDHIEITEDGVPQSRPVRHVTDPAAIAEHTTAVVAVKAHHTPTAADWLRALARPEVTVLVAQNGVEHRERVLPYVGPARIVPSVVYLNVERTQPGHAILRRVGTHDVAVPDDADGVALAAELNAGGIRTSTEADFTTVAWAKLLTNITANPLTALTGRRAEVMRDPEIERIGRRIMAEAVEVGRADGAVLTDEHIDRAMHWLQHVPEGSTTSMREDRLAGRPLEHDALTGAVARAAERHGIDVPANRFVLALLSAIEPEVTA
ncbi:2-dehydropantoate 2-reductase [Streptomyces sp. DG2A-72]|uniref:2-dehydropantoate 2-reductase n=1 Tax=Streptomyces sp. DG2A-72 TaxID=3051386 RepID=UPI00265BF7FD|nr:2-dehydropantoate 2-reductase [Streptomyces sp. DG2A-72]MDO0934966.1 2-dehydropantoate 2-reductase [Streptomyces sp. DG2A-72]